MTSSRAGTFACLLLGGLLAVVASAQDWWRTGGGGVSVAFSGTEASVGLSQALAVVVLAGTLLVLVLRVRGRRVVAALLALAGLGMVAVGLLRRQPSGDAVRTKVRQVSLTDTFALHATAWPWVFTLAGLVVVAGAVLLWRGSPGWAPRADRFQRTGVPAGATTGVPVSAEDDPAAVWRALDAGLDPTAGQEQTAGDGSAATAAAPDVGEPPIRGHNGGQQHGPLEPVRTSSRTGTPARTGNPSPTREPGD